MAKFRYPVNYIAISTYFKKGVHNGLDLGWNSKHGGKNQKIYSSSDGKVYSIKDNDKSGKSWGNYVKIYHGKIKGKKVYTLYAHLKDGIKVKKGQKVNMGDLLGLMGTTGASKGNHLHYEYYLGGVSTKYRVDPEKYTYVYEDQIVSKNKKAIEGLKYYDKRTKTICK